MIHLEGLTNRNPRKDKHIIEQAFFPPKWREGAEGDIIDCLCGWSGQTHEFASHRLAVRKAKDAYDKAQKEESLSGP